MRYRASHTHPWTSLTLLCVAGLALSLSCQSQVSVDDFVFQCEVDGDCPEGFACMDPTAQGVEGTGRVCMPNEGVGVTVVVTTPDAGGTVSPTDVIEPTDVTDPTDVAAPTDVTEPPDVGEETTPPPPCQEDKLKEEGGCDDGLFCNGVETCDLLLGCLDGVAPETDDGIPCTVDACDEETDQITHTPDHAVCDNGDWCDGSETCDLSDGCQLGVAPELDDGVDCTIDACDEETDQPTHTPDDTACDDGLFCTGVETCDVSDGCQPGSAPELDDGVGCTIDTCDDDSDDITHTPDDTLCVPSGDCWSATCDGATGCQESLVLDCCGNGLVEAGEVCEPAAADCWALEFDDAHVDVGNSPSFSFGDGANDSPFSVSAWVYVTSVQDSIVVSKSESGHEWIFGFQGDSTLGLGVYTGISTEQIAKTEVTQEGLEGAWHHIAATYDGSSGQNAADGIQVYIDGVSQAVVTEKGDSYVAMTPNNHPVWIGKQDANDFKGHIDEVRLWSRELSGEEIATKMNLSLDPGAEDGLVGYWPLNEGTGETTADVSGNDHHGTLEGANWVQDCGIGSDSGTAGSVACTDTCTLNSDCGTAGIESLSECECYLASLGAEDWEHCSTPGPVCADGQAAVRQCEPRPDTACYHLTEPEACAETIATPEGDEAAAQCFDSATCAGGACAWGSKADDDEQSCACILEALGKRTSCDVDGETLEPGDKACGENGAGVPELWTCEAYTGIGGLTCPTAPDPWLCQDAATCQVNTCGAPVDPSQACYWRDFDGDDFVSVEGVDYPSGGADRTISIWAQRTDDSTPQSMLSLGNGCHGDGSTCQHERFSLYVSEGAEHQFGIVGQGYDFETGHQLPLNTWVHVVVRLQDGTLTVWAQGEMVFEAGLAHDFQTDPGQPVMIGKNTHDRDDEHWRGQLRDVAIYGAALSDEAVVQLTTATPDAVQPGSLVGYWPLSGGDTDVVTDSSAAGNDGVSSGATGVQADCFSDLGDGELACGVAQADEGSTCDDGYADTVADVCAADGSCAGQLCGNGLVDDGEACDSGLVGETEGADSEVCEPGLQYCDGNTLSTCNAEGTGPLASGADCQIGGASALCGPDASGVLGCLARGVDCAEILQRRPDSLDGTYNIDPDGPGGSDAFDVYCDMTTDGGGWTALINPHDHAQSYMERFPSTENTVTDYVVDPDKGVSWGTNASTVEEWVEVATAFTVSVPYDEVRVVHSADYLGGMGKLYMSNQGGLLLWSTDAWSDDVKGQTLAVNGVLIYDEEEVVIENREDTISEPGSTELRIGMSGLVGYDYTRRHVKALWLRRDVSVSNQHCTAQCQYHPECVASGKTASDAECECYLKSLDDTDGFAFCHSWQASDAPHQCNEDGTLQVCEPRGDGCFAFSEPQVCVPSEPCRDSVCVGSWNGEIDLPLSESGCQDVLYTAGQACDDTLANTIDDQCDGQGQCVGQLCGNGDVDGGEACDDGAENIEITDVTTGLVAKYPLDTGPEEVIGGADGPPLAGNQSYGPVTGQVGPSFSATGETHTAFTTGGSTANFSNPALPQGASPRTISTWIKWNNGDSQYGRIIFGYGSNSHLQGFGYRMIHGYGWAGPNGWAFPITIEFTGGDWAGLNSPVFYLGDPLGHTQDPFEGHATHPDARAQYQAIHDAGGLVVEPLDWFHLTATYDGTSVKTYVNGVLCDNAHQMDLNTTGDNLVLGWGYSTPAAHDGDGVQTNASFDDFRVYDRALSQEEVDIISAFAPPLAEGEEAPPLVGGTCPYGEATCTLCSKTCQQVEGVPHFCGDGVVDEQESCDDGAANTTPGASCPYGEESCTLCSDSCESFPGEASYCGDGVVDEEVDCVDSCGGLSFSGDGAYVDLGAPATMDFMDAGAFTVATWVNVGDGIDERQTFVSSGHFPGLANGDASRYVWFVMEGPLGAGKIKAEIRGVNGPEETVNLLASAALTPGEWSHVAFSRDPGTMRLYVDGVMVGETAENAGDLNLVDDPIQIGNTLLPGAGTKHVPYQGELRALTFYDTALTEAQLQAVMTDPSHGSVVDSLQAHYPMNEGEGTTISDAHGSAGSGTFVGDIDWVDCPPALCPAEQCDDGAANTTPGASCPYGEESCTLCSDSCESFAGEVHFCGDGVVDEEEDCDDGNNVGLDGCPADCSWTYQDVNTALTCGEGMCNGPGGQVRYLAYDGWDDPQLEAERFCLVRGFDLWAEVIWPVGDVDFVYSYVAAWPETYLNHLAADQAVQRDVRCRVDPDAAPPKPYCGNGVVDDLGDIGPVDAGDIGELEVESTSDASVFNAATDAWHVTVVPGQNGKGTVQAHGHQGELIDEIAHVALTASLDGSAWTLMLTDDPVELINSYGGVYRFSGNYKSRGPGPRLGFGLTDGEQVVILGTRGDEGESSHEFTDWTISVDASAQTATLTMDGGQSEPVDISSLSQWRFYAEGPANDGDYKYYLILTDLEVEPDCAEAACSALAFDGEGAMARVPGSAAVLPEGDFCVEAWVRSEVGGKQPYVMSGVNAAQYHFILDCGPAGMRFAQENGAGNFISTIDPGTSCPSDGQWHHVAGCRSTEGGVHTLEVFLDGESLSVTSGSSSTVGTAEDLWMGGYFYVPDGDTFSGEMDGLRISNFVRYQGDYEVPGDLEVDEGTVLLYRFNEGEGSTFADASPNGIDGVVGPPEDMVGSGATAATWAEGGPFCSASCGEGAEACDDGNTNDDDGCSATCEVEGEDDPCDVDGDGAQSVDCGGADCDDGDPDVRPYGGDAYGDGVDGDCDGLDCEAGYVGDVYYAVCREDSAGDSVEADWSGSDAVCKAYGYESLAKAVDESENEGMMQLVTQAGSWNEIWIGLSDPEDDGIWTWMDGTEAEYFNWCCNEPSPNEENCVEIYGSNDWTWNDRPCDEPLPFVCEDRSVPPAFDDPDSQDFEVPEGFVLIPAGTFTMGAPAGEPGDFDDESQHQVTLTRDFVMQAYEVTQGDYDELMGQNPSHFSGCGADCPVDSVSWNDAVAYANALSLSEGLAPCYGDNGEVADGDSPYDCAGYRLPTEAEWEYAYRAGTTSALYNGEVTVDGWVCDPTDPLVDAIAWFCPNAGDTTHTVGQKAPNGWGLYDMAGNVNEWMGDEYCPHTDETVEDPTTCQEPGDFDCQGGGEGTCRVVRGGSWNGAAVDCRAAGYRNSSPASYESNVNGIRLVRTVPTSDDDTGAPDVSDFDWAQLSPEISPSARADCAMMYDEVLEGVVLFGGMSSGDEMHGDTWLWDGANWTPIALDQSPSARNDASLVYDPVNEVGVLLGGWNPSETYLQDTWLWDSVELSWSLAAPTVVPETRTAAAHGWDPVSERSVVFSGACSGGSSCFRDDTVGFDGADWSSLDIGGPTPRSDPASGSGGADLGLVIFGGNAAGGGGERLDDTWSWDGASWGEHTPSTSPSARLGGQMAYHEDLERMVLFGGRDGDIQYQDTWAWDGEDWEELQPSAAPSSFMNHCMAYDPVAEQVVLFGGYNGGYLDETWVFGAPEPGAGTEDNPGLDCADILAQDPDAQDETYWIDPDGDGGEDPFKVYCDMTTDGGGWTLFYKRGADSPVGADGISACSADEIGGTTDLSLGELSVGSEDRICGPKSLMETMNEVRCSWLGDQGEGPATVWYQFINDTNAWSTMTLHHTNPANFTCGSDDSEGVPLGHNATLMSCEIDGDTISLYEVNGGIPGTFPDKWDGFHEHDGYCVGRPPMPAGTAANPGLDCAGILVQQPDAEDGTYWIDPDGDGGVDAFEVHCDMVTRGGGWTLLGVGRPDCKGDLGESLVTSLDLPCHYLEVSRVNALAEISDDVLLRSSLDSGPGWESSAQSHDSLAVEALRTPGGHWHNGATWDNWKWSDPCHPHGMSGWPNMYHSACDSYGVHWFEQENHNGGTGWWASRFAYPETAAKNSAWLRRAICGDGAVSVGEHCDDGNTDDGDGCSSTCAVEVSCSALLFDDAGDYVQVATGGAIDLSDEDFTIEAWIYPTESLDGNVATVVADLTDASGGSGWTFWADWSSGGPGPGSSAFGFTEHAGGIFTNDDFGVVSQNVPPVNQWTHVAVTRAGEQFRLYYNGQLEASATSAVSFTPTGNDLTIGQTVTDGSGPNGWPGLIRDVRISTVARYGEDSFVPSTTLDSDGDTLAHWPLDEGEGTIAVDASGHGYTGIISGATWSENSPNCSAGGVGECPEGWGGEACDTFVAIGGYHLCLLKADGALVCWGLNGDGQSTPPEIGEGTAFASISAGYTHSCGLLEDGTALCWGNIAEPPGDAFLLGSMTGGLHHHCGLRVDGSATCWGQDNSGFGETVAPEGAFSSLAGATYHYCGLRLDGTVECWGRDMEGQSSPPAGVFTTLAAGTYHTCGLRTDGTAECWGEQDSAWFGGGFGQSTPLPGVFTSLVAGSQHTCGLRTDGTAECWGSMEFAQSQAPDGSFDLLAADGFNTCGIRADSTVECWGHDLHDQTDVPTP